MDHDAVDAAGDGPIFAIIVEMLSEQSGVPPSKIRLSSRVSEDLGMTGDDAGEYIGDFFGRFPFVNRDAFSFGDYFGTEGIGCFLPVFLGGRGTTPLTVEDVLKMVRDKRWHVPPKRRCIRDKHKTEEDRGRVNPDSPE